MAGMGLVIGGRRTAVDNPFTSLGMQALQTAVTPQQPQPVQGPTQEAAHNSSYFIDPQGLTHPFTPNPQTTTNQYQTGTGGTPTVSGAGSISSPAYEQQQQTQLESTLSSSDLEHRAALNDKAFKDRLAAVGGTGGGAAPSHVNYGGAEADAARAAAFARAKDQAGQTARASLDALMNVVGERGVVGGGYEGSAASSVINNSAGALDDFTREQLIQDLGHQEHVNDLKYQGDISQRGQDLTRMQSLLSLVNSGRLY